MNDLKWKKWIPVLLFSVTIITFFVFFLCVYTEETVSVYHAEPPHSYTVLTDLEMELSEDNTAPAGVRKIYRGILDEELSQESCLLFNIAHHSIEVYFGDELVYSLTGTTDNRITKNVSSNWCTVHVGTNHGGEVLTVVLTPLFEAAVSKSPEFLLGSDYAIAMDLITAELPLLVLSALCFLLGIFVVIVCLCFRMILKMDNNGVVYLGCFSIVTGCWKLTDLNCLPLLFPEHSLALGYISVGSLFLTGLCLLLYFGSLFMNGRQRIPLVLACGGSLLCLGILAAQVFGIAEIRQNLVFSHILLIVSIITIPVTALLNRFTYKSWGLCSSWWWLLIVFVGIAVDLLYYYRYNENGLMSFSILGLIIYTLIIFLKSVQDSTRKAYTDSYTGLVNRARWMELMNENRSAKESYAVLMIDMNGLKIANDTFGHDIGDRMISSLSDLLRRTLPRRSVICRWGGDEFAVMLTNISREHLDKQIQKIVSAGEKYNIEHPELPIYFAIGAALSSEHPESSRNELFRLADEDMYRNKKIWYSKS